MVPAPLRDAPPAGSPADPFAGGRRDAHWRTLPLLALLTLVLSGCAHWRDTAAGWIGQVHSPATVAGLAYTDIKRLGALQGECATLAEAHRQGYHVAAGWLRETGLPACKERVAAAREAWRRDRELDRLVDQAYQAVQAHQAELARQAAQRKRIREDIKAQRLAAEALNKMAEEQALSRLRERLNDANIRALLKDVPDQPLAYAVGQPSQRSMKDFLSCLEVGYPNQGYQVQHGDNRLTVTALQANMLRGDVDIRAHFVNVWDTWLLESLTVAEMKATTPQDRFLLAQNLLAGHCYGIDDLL